jgi:protein-S-isoprenylcysteine O-methyltransferase Ste14
MKPFTTIGAIVFAIMALVHLYRLIHPFDLVVGDWSAPQWVSIVGLLVAGILSIKQWRESRR